MARVFEKIAPAKADHLVRQADDGLLSLDELDKIGGEGETGSIAAGALQVIFGQVSSADILLPFAADDSLDTKIEEKKRLLPSSPPWPKTNWGWKPRRPIRFLNLEKDYNGTSFWANLPSLFRKIKSQRNWPRLIYPPNPFNGIP